MERDFEGLTEEDLKELERSALDAKWPRIVLGSGEFVMSAFPIEGLCS